MNSAEITVASMPGCSDLSPSPWQADSNDLALRDFPGAPSLKTTPPLEQRDFDHFSMIASDLAQCKRVQQDILTLAQIHDFNEQERFQIQVALEEAIVNAVKHGNGSDPTRWVFIEYSVDTFALRVRIADEGIGFDPDAVPDPTLTENLERPCGRGLMLMRFFMTGVQFNDRGNCVEMWRKRT